MEIESDLEFYCYLKKSLTGSFQIISEPDTAYYSEWYFNYTILKDGKLYKKYSGDFRKQEKGILVQEAKLILKELQKNKKDDYRK